MPVRGPLFRFLAGLGLVLVATLSVVGGIALRGPGLVAVDKLFGTPAASLITALQQMPVMLFNDEQAQAAVD